MKFKVLLTGRGFTIIDDFFMKTPEDFECMTTSDRAADIQLHISMFEPDVIVFCAKEETKDRMQRIHSSRQRQDKTEVPVVIVGDRTDVALYNSVSGGADLTLYKPLSVSKIQEEIRQFLIQRIKREYEDKANDEQAAAEMNAVLEAYGSDDNVEETEADGSKKHVLIIDDDPVMLKTIRLYLEESYQVATALSGKLALKFLEKKKTDVILLDYEMPFMNGPEVLIAIRGNERLANIPVVFLTGVNELEKIQMVLSMKPQGYLLKPVNNEELHKTLDKVLNNE